MPLLGSFGVSSFGLGAYAAPAPADSYDLLETEILTTSGVTSVNFTSLSTYANDYQHLQIRVATLNGSNRTGLQFNADTASNYNMHFLYGTGTTVASGAASNTSYITTNVGKNSTGASSVGASVIDILDPFETTKYTTVRSLTGNIASSLIVMYSGAWRNTASLSSIQIVQTEPSSGIGTWDAGSRFSLYGLKKAA